MLYQHNSLTRNPSQIEKLHIFVFTKKTLFKHRKDTGGLTLVHNDKKEKKSMEIVHKQESGTSKVTVDGRLKRGFPRPFFKT